MPGSPARLPEWERLLSSAARLQQILPGAVLVGGTAAAIHAEHRFSLDADHVLTDLRRRFDEVLEQLESVGGRRTARLARPVQILGSLDGIQTARWTGRRTRRATATATTSGSSTAGRPGASRSRRRPGTAPASIFHRANSTRQAKSHRGRTSAGESSAFDGLCPSGLSAIGHPIRSSPVPVLDSASGRAA